MEFINQFEQESKKESKKDSKQDQSKEQEQINIPYHNPNAQDSKKQPNQQQDEQQEQKKPLNPQLEAAEKEVAHQQKLEYFYQQQNINQQNLTMSVTNLKGFYQEQFDDYSLDPSKSDHPSAAFFHFLLKAIPVLIFMFLGIFVQRAWTVPEIVVVTAALDFWVTKNVTGRLLLGLRWWEEIDEASGKQLWVFECRVNNSTTKYLLGMLSFGCHNMGILHSYEFFGVKYLKRCCSVFCLITNCTNFYFFFKCSRVQTQRAKQMMAVVGKDMLMKMANQSVIWPMKNPNPKSRNN